MTKTEPISLVIPHTLAGLRLDLALSKLERNSQRDRDDVKFLARSARLSLQVLQQRYEEELRPNLDNPEREDLTLRLWMEAIEEERAG